MLKGNDGSSDIIIIYIYGSRCFEKQINYGLAVCIADAGGSAISNLH